MRRSVLQAFLRFSVSSFHISCNIDDLTALFSPIWGMACSSDGLTRLHQYHIHQAVFTDMPEGFDLCFQPRSRYASARSLHRIPGVFSRPSRWCGYRRLCRTGCIVVGPTIWCIACVAADTHALLCTTKQEVWSRHTTLYSLSTDSAGSLGHLPETRVWYAQWHLWRSRGAVIERCDAAVEYLGRAIHSASHVHSRKRAGSRRGRRKVACASLVEDIQYKAFCLKFGR